MSGFFSSEAEMALSAEEQEVPYFYCPTMMAEGPNRSVAPQGNRVPSGAADSFGPAYSSRQQWTGQAHATSMSTDRMRISSGPGVSSPYQQPIVPSSSNVAAQSGSPWQTLRPHEYQQTTRRPSLRSRSPSPNPSELYHFGYPSADGKGWRCAHPECTSQTIFTRGCDLRKHFRRHTKSLFCRHASCRDSKGFSSKKDRDRHEASHRPEIACDWEGCDKIFSRVDNMKDHLRRIHQKPSR